MVRKGLAVLDLDGRISIRLRSRGRGRVRAINIPNLPFSTDRISVQLNDFE
jgi:hypothetical protein